jgi:sigma-B regulation protein RsbU (phosphoserine phosphatase)
MSILIIDDSIIHRTLIEDILHHAGYIDTISLDSADGASIYLSEEALHPDAPTLDLILMDIMMPDVNGLEACRLIKSDPRLADVPIIIVTAMTDADSLRQAFAGGAIDYIRKPILAVELVARVNTVLTMMYEMSRRKRHEHELEVAMRELKALRGCAPICASCKRIRDPSGEWRSLEDYVKTLSDLRVDDTICQHCIEQWNNDQEAA